MICVGCVAAALEPGYLVTEVFRKLCSMEATCEKCLCKDSVTNALLAPVSAVLDRGVSPALNHMVGWGVFNSDI